MLRNLNSFKSRINVFMDLGKKSVKTFFSLYLFFRNKTYKLFFKSKYFEKKNKKKMEIDFFLIYLEFILLTKDVSFFHEMHLKYTLMISRSITPHVELYPLEIQ